MKMKYILIDAVKEIRNLRHQNEVFAAKVEVMDLFALVLNTQPNHPSSVNSLDIAHQMEKLIDDLELEEDRKKSNKEIPA